MPHPSAACRRLRSPPGGPDERHRFLRPGALARLRDSKIVARSLRSAASEASYARSPLLPPCSPPRPATPSLSAETGGVPHFFFGVGSGGARGPRYPLRKKLAAARGVVFLPPPPMSPDAAADAFFGAFATAPSEMVAAH